MESAKRNIPLSRNAANDIHPLSERPTFCSDQLDQYLVHLHRTLPSTAYRLSLDDLRAQADATPLKAISTLMRLHLSATPWGNLSLHYSPNHTISITPPSLLFNKLITRNRGGYCMEQNLLFATVLRSFGFQVSLTGARISNALDLGSNKDKEGFGGWGHMVLFVTSPSLNDERYLVDVGFGSGNALSPIALNDGAEVPCQPGQKGRIVRRRLAASTLSPKQDMWVYQNKVVGKEDVGEEGWTNAYCFGEVEWFEEDFVVCNFKTSRSAESWFTWTFVMTRMILRGDKAAAKDKEEGAGAGERMGVKEVEIVGSVTLFGGNLTRRLGGGESEVLKELRSETERVEALREWFGIEMADEEQEGIRGMVTELKG